MAALAGLGVIQRDRSGCPAGRWANCPAGDGSSQHFVETIEEAGMVEQDAAVEPLVIRKPVQVTHGRGDAGGVARAGRN